ncbi:MAG: YdgA family protein [Proteobacteria bacterium]|nr:YdgA family protein [Pseudomonadota bacterium]
MKKFTGLVVILAALVLGSYYGMGYLTEKKIREDLEKINETNGINVQISEYNRHWFSSDAIFNWKLYVPEQVLTNANGQTQTVPAHDYQLQMPLTIHHGPVIFANKTVKFGLGYAHTDLTLPEKYVEQFNDLFTADSIKPQLGLSLFVSYLNNASLDTSIPAFKLIAKQGNAQFDWLGMNSTTSISPKMDEIEGNVAIDGMRFVKDQANTNLAAITSEYNLHQDKDGLYFGDVSFAFPSLVIMNQATKLLEIDQFNVRSNTNIENSLFSSQFKVSIDKLVSHDKTYGPGNLEVAIRNLDAEVLARINQQVNQIQQSQPAERQMAMLALLPELPKLFSKGPQFEISEMNLNLPEGAIEGNLLISLPKTDAGNPLELIKMVQGNGKLKVPAPVLKNLMTQSIAQRLANPEPPAPQTIQESIVQQMQQQAVANQAATQVQSAAPATTSVPAKDPAVLTAEATVIADKQLASMLQSGLIMQQGNDFVVDFKLEQGQLIVNNKPFDSSMLKFQ